MYKEKNFIDDVKSFFLMTEKDFEHKDEHIHTFDYPYFVYLDDEKVGCMYLHSDKHVIANHIHLCYLFIYSTNKGTGTEVLSKVCQLADQHRMTLFLDAVPQRPNENSIPQWKLKEWYKSFGFIQSEYSGSNDMERTPCI